MYVPRLHQLNDPERLHSLIESHPLAAWVCHTEGGLVANHVPFFLDRNRGPHGTLVGHVARANSVWHSLNPATPSVLMFQGPQTYITPGWYPGKAQHGKVVPTWNYAVVHAHGVARVVRERDWLLDMLQRLTQASEVKQAKPWRVGDAPPDYIEQMLKAIVGIEIPIDRIEGKLKASQDEDRQDRAGTVAGLQASPDGQSQAMAALVQQALDSESEQGPH